MIAAYCGPPGVGKTTILASIGRRELELKKQGKSPYKHILCNFYCEGLERVEFDDLGQYDIEHSLILLDEVTLDADSRDFKKFEKTKKIFFVLHRHVYCDVIYFCQDYSRVDKTIKNMTSSLWLCHRSAVPFFKEWTTCNRLYPDWFLDQNGDLKFGYRLPRLDERLFDHTRKSIYRRPWYKYFDSHDKMDLAGLPPFEYVLWSSGSVAEDFTEDLPSVGSVKIKARVADPAGKA